MLNDNIEYSSKNDGFSENAQCSNVIGGTTTCPCNAVYTCNGINCIE